MRKWLLGSNLITKADRLGTYAAALAYGFVLSIVPFLALSFTLGLWLATQFAQGAMYTDRYAFVLHEILPTGSVVDVGRIISAVKLSTQGGFITISSIFAAYASFTLMLQIIHTLNFIFDDPRRAHGLDWKVFVKSLALLIIWMLLLLLISISAMEATFLQRFLRHYLESNMSRSLVNNLQTTVVLAALYGTFFLTYTLVPKKRQRVSLVFGGSLIATLGWIAGSLAVAYVLPQLLKASAAYVALGSIVLILLWAQACAWSVILGACWIVRFSRSAR